MGARLAGYSSMGENMHTHRNLVDIAYRWVLKNGSCGVAFKELMTTSNEIPDVIGFGSWGHSVLIECKVSRGDFLSDKKKPFRVNPELGMGSHRFYCCPTGIIKVEDLPAGWGLIYVNERGRATKIHGIARGTAAWHKTSQNKNVLAEIGIMYGALRRLQMLGRLKDFREEYRKLFEDKVMTNTD